MLYAVDMNHTQWLPTHGISVVVCLLSSFSVLCTLLLPSMPYHLQVLYGAFLLDLTMALSCLVLSMACPWCSVQCHHNDSGFVHWSLARAWLAGVAHGCSSILIVSKDGHNLTSWSLIAVALASWLAKRESGTFL
jgi:hypothetical protein